jgi:ABC-type phosphate transport system substrate-binding protein
MWSRREWLIAMAALASRSAFADDGGFIIVVHPDNPITTVERDFLRDAYLKKATDWGGGATIRPVDLATRFAVRDAFTHEVLRKTPSQLRKYWNQQIFSGKGTPPVEAGTLAELLAYVVATPGAVGYLPAGASPGRAKVVKVT